MKREVFRGYIKATSRIKPRLAPPSLNRPLRMGEFNGAERRNEGAAGTRRHKSQPVWDLRNPSVLVQRRFKR